jgi:hypothetical protein
MWFSVMLPVMMSAILIEPKSLIIIIVVLGASALSQNDCPLG